MKPKPKKSPCNESGAWKMGYEWGVKTEQARIEELIVQEILVCNHENTPTSRLTSLMMKIRK